MGIGSCGKATRKQRAEIVLELMPEYPLKGLLRLAGLARSTYYYIIGNRQRSRHEVARKEIMRIFETHKGRYGYRRICEELRRNGHKTNHKTVQRLMRELGLKGKAARPTGTGRTRERWARPRRTCLTGSSLRAGLMRN